MPPATNGPVMRATDASCQRPLTGADAEKRERAFQYERAADEPPSRAVLAAVAEATERPVVPHHTTDPEGPSALPPLYEAIDPDALDALVASAGMGDRQFQLTFTYDAYRVTVRRRTVTIRPAP